MILLCVKERRNRNLAGLGPTVRVHRRPDPRSSSRTASTRSEPISQLRSDGVRKRYDSNASHSRHDRATERQINERSCAELLVPFPSATRECETKLTNGGHVIHPPAMPSKCRVRRRPVRTAATKPSTSHRRCNEKLRRTDRRRKATLNKHAASPFARESGLSRVRYAVQRGRAVSLS